mgnify:FL=1|tara:strand:- start:1367 stop:3253 length:1887 start_codon:yes stop_codon:yes gene_type:complete
MEKIIVELEAKTNEAVKGVEEVKKSVGKLGKEVKESNKATEKGLSAVAKTSKTVVGGLKKIGGTLKAIGFGLLIAALSTVKELFEGNQKAVDFFSTAFETASIVVGQVVNAFTNVYKAVSESSKNFDALGKVMSGLLTVAINPFKLAFFGIKLGIQQSQLAWENSVFGGKNPETIKQLTEDIKETKEAFSEVAYETALASGEIVNNFSEAVTEAASIGSKISEEVGKISVSTAIETAKANVELTKSAELAAATQGLIFEKFDRQAEKLRQIRDEERNSLADRKKANDELLISINEAEQNMLSQARMQLQIANANLEKDKENTESKVAQIEALKELAGVEAQIEGLRSEQKSNDLALSREQIELTNSKLESESTLSIERQRFNAELIQDELLRLEALKEIDLLEAEQEAERLEAIVMNADAGTQAKIDAQIVLDEFNEQSRQTNLQREQDIEGAKIAMREKALDDIISIANAETAVGKAALVAKQLLMAKELIMEIKKTITFATQAGARSAVAISEGTAQTAKIGFPQNIPMLIGYAAQAAGIYSAIKSATSKAKTTAPPSPNISSGSSSPRSAPSLPPSFNIVGASETSQLADSIGGQSKEPIKAFVVANDVSSAQEMDRNIIEGASL